MHGRSEIDPTSPPWNEVSRLHPTRRFMEHPEDQRVTEALTSLRTNLGPAAVELERLAVEYA